MGTNFERFSRRSALGLIGAAASGAVLGPAGRAAGATAVRATPTVGATSTSGSTPVDGAAPVGVELVDNGSTVTLSNGLVSATVNKSTAQTTSLKLTGSRYGNQDFNVLSGASGGGYTTFNYRVGTTTYTKSVSAASYRVVSQSVDRAEIAITVNDSTNLPFVVETHVALEAGAPGLYYYMIFAYPSTMPDELSIQQLRYAFAAGDPSFTYFVVDDRRGIQRRPTIAQTQQWKTLQDTTYELPDGTIYSKYQNISDLEGDNHVFMVSNGKVGLSLIQAGKEAFAGGPTRQELTTHDYHDGEILLWHPFSSHFGTPELAPAKGWQKIYGPFFLYANESATATDPTTATPDPAINVRAMWADAKAKAGQERAKWPYFWVPGSLYAAASRSTVTGRLRISTGESAANAWVVLSAPGEDWQYENEQYLYSARADQRGGFSITGVRSGSYTLTAFVAGVLGEYQKNAVTVDARSRADLGSLTWIPVSHGTTLWQIGTPNRSAGEFHIYGGATGFRKYLTWLEYPYEFPDGVDFKVGVDDPAKKWNFFHPAYRTPGTDLQLAWRGTTPDRSLTSWQIRFDSAGYRHGVATLDIALSSSVFGTLKVALNGVDLVNFDPLPGVPGDNASYRLSDRAMYRQLSPIVFPAASIRRGENIVTLSPVRAPTAPTSDNWMEPMGGVMYDVIRLQVDQRSQR